MWIWSLHEKNKNKNLDRCHRIHVSVKISSFIRFVTDIRRYAHQKKHRIETIVEAR